MPEAEVTERVMSSSPARWFGPIVAIVAVTDIAVLGDLPVLRQVASFIFLIFIPGFALLHVLKLGRLGWVEKAVLSVGLSAAFVMLFGLVLSVSLPAAGIAQPLSTVPLLISFTTATVVMAVIAYMRNKGGNLSFPGLNLTAQEKTFLVIPAVFPCLSIMGMRVMNATGNNSLLMVLLAAIAAYVVYILLNRRKVPDNTYPAAIFLISVSVLLLLSLRSNHLLGSDVHEEYSVFMATMQNLKWSQLGRGILDSCLSISVLPSVYQTFLNINPEFLFKILYSLICSFTPLAIYIISRKYIGSAYAFLAAFVFMSQAMFLWTAANARTNIAILFFALAIMTLFHDGISEFNKRVLFAILAVACIVSHYATSYVFLAVLTLTWIGGHLLPRITARLGTKKASQDSGAASQRLSSGPNTAVPAPGARGRMTLTMVALFFTILFIWYAEVITSVFKAGVNTVQNTVMSMNEIFVLESRGGQLSELAGGTITSRGIPYRIEFVATWALLALIAVGVIYMLLKHKDGLPPHRAGKPPTLPPRGFETGYLATAVACGLLLVVIWVFPYISRAYGPSRGFVQLVVPLAVCFIIGAMTLGGPLRKILPPAIMLTVAIVFFLCNTGLVHQIGGTPREITLNSSGNDYTTLYVHDQESAAARWISEYGEVESTIYTDNRWKRWQSQGGIARSRINRYLISRYEKGEEINGYICLGYLNVVEGEFRDGNRPTSIAEYPGLLAGRDKIYATNGSEIYR